MDEDLLVAHVTEVRGTRIKAKVIQGKNEAHLFYKGELVRNVSVGGYVKIPCGFDLVIGKIDGEYQAERFNLSDDAGGRAKSSVLYDRMIDVSVFGVLGRNGFERGITVLPLVASKVYVLTAGELASISSHETDEDEGFEIGELAGNEGISVSVPIGGLFASHIGIFGNTGSGKSNTLCKLYTDCFERIGVAPSATSSRFIVVDFNGEYAGDGVLHSTKEVFKLRTADAKGDKIPVPAGFYLDASIWSMLTSATEKTQRPFLERVVKTAELILSKTNFDTYLLGIVKNVLRGYSNAPTMYPEQRDELNRTLAFLVDKDDLDGSQKILESDTAGFQIVPQGQKLVLIGNGIFGDTPEKVVDMFDGVLSQCSSVGKLLGDMPSFMLFVARLVFLQRWQNGSVVREHIAWWLPRYERQLSESKKIYEVSSSPIGGTGLQVISLLDVNQEQKKTVPLVVAKYAYEQQKGRNSTDPQSSTHLIIDEAHNILSYSSQRESESWRDYRLETFEEIIKEGRKFGMYMTVCSQRPSDISSTIISQLHNYFIHRLVNDEDLRAVEKAVSFIDAESFSMIPALPQGGCVVSGTAVSYPVRIQVAPLPEGKRPASGDRDLYSTWLNDYIFCKAGDDADAGESD